MTKRNLPLKFGLILASYPEVLPINLSKKSEGDRVCEGDFPDLESCSLQKAALNKLLATISDYSACTAFPFMRKLSSFFESKILINTLTELVNISVRKYIFIFIRQLYFRSKCKFQEEKNINEIQFAIQKT